MLGLTVAAVLLANWKLSFATDARQLYRNVYPDAAAEAEDGTPDGSITLYIQHDPPPLPLRANWLRTPNGP